jgi:hypothetical protein
MNSREKGKRGERAWRDELRANGYDARRGQQFAGSPDSPDVVCGDLPWIHFEVKAVERLNIEEAMEQARGDCGMRSAECGIGKGHLTPALSPSGEGAPADPPSPCGCGAAKVPIVAHRRRFRGWLVTMEAETFFKFLMGDFPPTPRPSHPGEGGPGGRSERAGGHRADNVAPFVQTNLAGTSVSSDNTTENRIRKET